MQSFTFKGYNIVITNEIDPSNSKLTINGQEIPILYSIDHKGWHVHHTLWGWFEELELLAKHLIISNPRTGCPA